MQKKGQKRGLSTIVITLIIILISLVAVGIIWVVVRNVIQSGTEGIALGQFTLGADIINVNVDNSSNNVSLSVKRSSGEGEITGIKFIFSDEADSEIITEKIAMNKLEEKRFTFHLTKLAVSKLISISIVPVLASSSGKETLGSVLSKYNVQEGTSTAGGTGNQTSCFPNCTGKVCGSDGCGGSCGGCSGGQTCNSTGSCVASCAPATNPCGTRVCGNVNNGTCGTISCGTCSTGTCNSTGSCVVNTSGNVTGNFRYVRQGATGANNGSDWNNAYTAIPATLLRNYTYYIADGDYGSYLFNTAESGIQIITIKKAILSNHGTDYGWINTYGDGQTIFGNSRYVQSYWNFTGVNFATGYWTFDGVTGSGGNKADYGFLFKTDYDSFSTYPAETYLAINAAQARTFNNITARHFAMECSGYSNSMSKDNHSEVGVLATSQANVISPIIQYFYINNCQVNMYTNGANWIVEYGFFGNHWSSTVNHGVQVQDSASTGNTFRNNIFNYCDPICIEGETGGKFYNNIFIPGPGTYANVRLISGSGGQSVFNTSIYGNTIINHRGVILYQTSGPAGSGNAVQNNLFYNSSGVIDPTGGNPINASHNSYFSCYNVNLSQPGVQNSSGNPFVNLQGGDYRLVSSTNPGLSLPAPYNLDFNGNTRGADGNWDRGAIEYVA